MSKSRKRSICEGVLNAALIFAVIEYIVEGIYSKTIEVLELLKINPEAPQLLQLSQNIQAGKGLGGFILSVVGLGILKWKFDVEINFWHLGGVILGFIGYGFYLAFSYYPLFPVT